MNKDKILSMLGLVKKAGRLAGGEFAVSKAVKEGRARLVVVAADSSNNTQKMFINMCTFYQVPCYLYSSKEALGHALGRDIQASVAVLDDGFADAIIKKFKDFESNADEFDGM